ncbi:hypothetical protein HPB49_010160 [Dermacentor silvarum]|uniref:Uncharacterized protein n=1 Tax=Dermacentor silvarum TaxID=543639 RepID=A0ACB8CEF1_DERSI|nr:hypothetical protein HPB49_010160 [Dermacentor silvarum]
MYELAKKLDRQKDDDVTNVSEDSSAVRIDIDQDADLVGDPELNRALTEVGPCALVKKRQDIMGTGRFNDKIRITNKEQHEFLREIIHLQTTPQNRTTVPSLFFAQLCTTLLRLLLSSAIATWRAVACEGRGRTGEPTRTSESKVVEVEDRPSPTAVAERRPYRFPGSRLRPGASRQRRSRPLVTPR